MKESYNHWDALALFTKSVAAGGRACQNEANTVIGPPLYHSSQVETRRVVLVAEGTGDVTADRPLSLEKSKVASHRTGQMGVPGSIYSVCIWIIMGVCDG